MPEDRVRIKKVKAYPISGQVKNDIGTVIPIKIVKLAGNGFLAEVSDGFIKVGQKVEATFELPVIHHLVSESCVVIKTYDQFAAGSSALRVAELHFRTLGPASREKLGEFLQMLSRTG